MNVRVIFWLMGGLREGGRKGGSGQRKQWAIRT